MQEQIIFLSLYVVNAVNKVNTISNYCLYLSYQTLKMLEICFDLSNRIQSNQTANFFYLIEL